MTPQDDIITAIITPIGEGGISVLRVSGKGAIELSSPLFQGKASLLSALTHTAHFGCFVAPDGDVVDEVVATIFRAPHSYTADDTVEFSCHGGIYISRKILEAILKSGARAAEPGEFTKRAFVNGRIDLSQAEAVADLIKSRSEYSRRASMLQLQGRLSKKVGELRARLLDICSLLELELDFSEEGLRLADKSRINKELDVLIDEISRLVDSYHDGKLDREGVRIVLAGKPNVGKSSILNSLLREDRAIVTHIPGTTRDVIQESASFGGLLFSVSDTAGLRESEDIVEKEGIARSKREIEQADIVVYVVEPGPITESERSFISYLQMHKESVKKLLIVVNKTDLDENWQLPLPLKELEPPPCYLSAKTGSGLGTFKESLVSLALKGNGSAADASPMVTNERQRNCLATAQVHLSRARADLGAGKGNEFLAVSIRLAMDSLSEVVGGVTTDDILNNIFANFCIGK